MRPSWTSGDAASVSRQPTLAGSWAPAGAGPVADPARRAAIRHRRRAALAIGDGRVVHPTGRKTDVAHLCRFLQALRAADPARVLVRAWDNWPVHQPPTVLAEARAPRIRRRWLPTSAPGTHPTERPWRWLRQEVIPHHRLADHEPALQVRVGAFLDRFAHGADALLRSVGEWTD